MDQGWIPREDGQEGGGTDLGIEVSRAFDARELVGELDRRWWKRDHLVREGFRG